MTRSLTKGRFPLVRRCTAMRELTEVRRLNRENEQRIENQRLRALASYNEDRAKWAHILDRLAGYTDEKGTRFYAEFRGEPSNIPQATMKLERVSAQSTTIFYVRITDFLLDRIGYRLTPTDQRFAAQVLADEFAWEIMTRLVAGKVEHR